MKRSDASGWNFLLSLETAAEKKSTSSVVATDDASKKSSSSPSPSVNKKQKTSRTAYASRPQPADHLLHLNDGAKLGTFIFCLHRYKHLHDVKSSSSSDCPVVEKRSSREKLKITYLGWAIARSTLRSPSLDDTL